MSLSREERERKRKYEERYKEKYGRYRDRSPWGTRAIPLTYRCAVPDCADKKTVRHHIIPRSEGGSNEAHNLIELCRDHHLVFERIFTTHKRKILGIKKDERKSFITELYNAEYLIRKGRCELCGYKGSNTIIHHLNPYTGIVTNQAIVSSRLARGSAPKQIVLRVLGVELCFLCHCLVTPDIPNLGGKTNKLLVEKAKYIKEKGNQELLKQLMIIKAGYYGRQIISYMQYDRILNLPKLRQSCCCYKSSKSTCLIDPKRRQCRQIDSPECTLLRHRNINRLARLHIYE